MIITITGQNDFLRSRELAELQTKFVQTHGESGLERISGESIETGQLLDSLQAQSLFTPERLVVVRDLSANKPAIAKTDEILAAVADGITVVLHEPTLDMRTAYAKALQKQTDFRRFDEPRDFELANWLVEAAKERGGAIDKGTADLLVRRVGPMQQILSSELDKLLAYDPKVTRQSVELLSVPSAQSSIFDLLAAAFGGEVDKALRLYKDQRIQNMEAAAILSMIAWQLHALIVTKLGGQRTPNDIAKAAGLSPYVIKNSQGLARQLSANRLKQLAQQVIELEVTMKSQAIDIDDAVQTFLISIAQR